MRRADKSTRIKMIGTTSISTRPFGTVGWNSQFLSSSLVKVHHSFGRAHDHSVVVCVPERGVFWICPLADRVRGPDRPRLLMLPICAVRVKPRAPVVGHGGASGAEETRTPDFLLAKEALYQLSYGPRGARRILRLATRGPPRDEGAAAEVRPRIAAPPHSGRWSFLASASERESGAGWAPLATSWG